MNAIFYTLKNFEKVGSEIITAWAILNRPKPFVLECAEDFAMYFKGRSLLYWIWDVVYQYDKINPFFLCAPGKPASHVCQIQIA